ncbi:MAG: MerR family transcriptional regulator [Planctomycetota bacterium]
MTDSGIDTGEDLLSIGDVADATGISVDTIRVWERRYGRPVPVRLPSGHRRYTVGHVRWLRRIAEALAGGHRPSKVVKLGDEDLDRLLEPAGPAEEEADAVKELVELVGRYDGDAIRSRLRDYLEEHGPRALLRKRTAPLLTAVGRAWADGTLDVRHEHFVSSILEDFMRSMRLGLPETTGPIALFATLSGEVHGLGLQMAALTAAVAGLRPRILGTDTPNAEIVSAAAEIGAAGVCLSVSLATGGVRTDRVLADLRSALPDDVRLVIGGRGARGVRRGPRGVEYVEDLDDFERWLLELAGGASDDKVAG